jgi:hypothetical protein
MQQYDNVDDVDDLDYKRIKEMFQDEGIINERDKEREQKLLF